MPNRFEDLDIETIIVATNHLDRNEVAYEVGPLRPAVAGSMAFPDYFAQFYLGKCTDRGRCSNPLPYDLSLAMRTLSLLST
jgi:NTE family protein